MRSDMAVKAVKSLYRTGRLKDAVAACRDLSPESDDYWLEMTAGIDALMELGNLTDAVATAEKAALGCDPASSSILKVYAASVRVFAHPDAASRERLRKELDALRQRGDPIALAIAARWEARLIALEIAVQVRPVTDLPAVLSCCRLAAVSFQQAGYGDESRHEFLREADFVETGPPHNRTAAKSMYEELQKKASTSDDLVCTAKIQLALAGIAFEEVMAASREPDDADFTRLLEIYDAALESYSKAEIICGEASVRAALGRKLLRFGQESGVQELRAAAEIWENAGHGASAGNVWRDLHTWHVQRAERAEAEAIEEKLAHRPTVDSTLESITTEVQMAHAAFVRGDLAESGRIAEFAADTAATPAHMASLLLLNCTRLQGQGAISAAREAAERAVALLRPAEPCASLGDALFQLGNLQSDLHSRTRLWEEAATGDTACGLSLSAANRYINIAETLSQSGPRTSAHNGKTPEEYFELAADLCNGRRDEDSVVLRGNLAQRRGLAAFRAEDYPACGRWLTEAEECFRRTGRIADLAFTLGHQGLVLYRLGQITQNPELFCSAYDRFIEASQLFERQDLLGERFRMERLAGAASWDMGNLQSGEDRSHNYEAASQHMKQAATLMEILRRGRREQELFVRQESLEDIADTMEPFLEEAFRFHLNVLNRPADAISWLEKRKARGLLDALSSSVSISIPHIDSEWSLQERRLLEERAAISGSDYLARKRWRQATASLEQLWENMSASPEWTTYGTLRRGMPLNWPQWLSALRQEHARPEAGGRRVTSIHLVWPRSERSPIQLLASSSDWDQPRSASVDLPSRRVQAFAEQCFGGRGRSAITKWLRMAGATMHGQKPSVPSSNRLRNGPIRETFSFSFRTDRFILFPSMR